jgi:hypothetical protein
MKKKMETKVLSVAERKALIDCLRKRFETNKQRHPSIEWQNVLLRLETQPAKLKALKEMERTEGEPDVVGLDPVTGEYIFMDCSPESPQGRRSLCYDRQALDSRKLNKPTSSAMDMAAELGIELLTEEEYRLLQTVGSFDTKTSSWLETPSEIRQLGGAIFGDFRYGTVFIYHNGAQSYFEARGFRGVLRV